jgi:thioredoxin-like negative regulator of GroEL
MSIVRDWLAGRSRRTQLVLAAAIAVGLALFAYRAYRAAGAEYHYREAAAAASRDDQPAARRHLAACLAERPDSGELNFLMARAARRDGDYSAAGKFLKLAEAGGWSPEAVRIEKTLLRAQTGQFRQVEETILRWAERGAEEQPLFFEVLIPNYLQRHDLNLAYGMLTTWTEREPKNVRALVWMVETCERLGLIDQTRAAARAAAEAAPDRADVQLKCGQVLADYQAAEAKPHFERALQLSPGDRAARFGLAKCLYALGDVPTAVSGLDELIAEGGEDPAALGLRGKIALQADDPKRAAELFKRALSHAPFEGEILGELAQAMTQLGKEDEAKRYRERQEAADKDLKELEETRKAVAKDPRNADLRYKAGVILLRNGLTEGGVRWLQSALAEDPSHEPSRKALAEARREPHVSDPR